MLNFVLCPRHVRAQLEGYILRGGPPGGFLFAMLSNDLRDAFARADEINREQMFWILQWLWNEAPSECWGSAARVNAWVAHSGLHGYAGRAQPAEAS